jgi:hypothetical protein
MGVISFVLCAVHYGFFGWRGAAICFAVLLTLFVFFVQKRRNKYFIEADAEGIRWRQNIFARYNNIPWKYLQRVDYLEFEINFMLKETAQVVSFATSGLPEEKISELKSAVSDIIKERKELIA